MLLEPTPELESPPKRGKTLIISVLVHVVLVAILLLDPNLFDSSLKRVIRIEGNDYDAKLTELDLQPVPRLSPRPESSKPLPEPPKNVQPPPPEPPPPPPPPAHVITPDDVLAPGAKPDGQAQASRGNSADPLKQGGPAGDSTPAPAHTNPAPAPSAPNPPLVASNANPNAPTLPNLAQQAMRNADKANSAQMRAGGPGGATMTPKTGRANAPNGQNFSADGGVEILSDTKGYDFGPYMNQVLNRVRSNWLIPDRAMFGAKGRVIIIFTITKNGDVVDCRIVGPSGESSLDGAAKAAIDGSNPFQRLPPGFSGNELQLRFGFYYNIPVE